MCVHYSVVNGELIAKLVKKVMGEYVTLKTWRFGGGWPKAEMPLIYQTKEGRAFDTMRWGVRASYDFAENWVPVVNARDDKLRASKMWIEAVETRRCIIPADGFFEWVGPKGGKWEVYFERPGGEPFFFAGIWSPDSQKDGSRGFAMVTTSPNDLLAAVPHDRMPAILDEVGAKAWLGHEPADIFHLLRPYPGDLVRKDLPPPEKKPPKSKKITKPDLDKGELDLGLG